MAVSHKVRCYSSKGREVWTILDPEIVVLSSIAASMLMFIVDSFNNSTINLQPLRSTLFS